MEEIQVTWEDEEELFAKVLDGKTPIERRRLSDLVVSDGLTADYFYFMDANGNRVHFPLHLVTNMRTNHTTPHQG